jgi:hypothetical protein
VGPICRQHIPASEASLCFVVAASKVDDDLLETGLHVPGSRPALRNDESIAGMKFVSRAVGVDGNKIALQDIYEFVKRIVSRLQGARFASPKGDLVTGKDAGLVHAKLPTAIPGR